MDPEDLEKRITPKTRAVIAIHLFGLVGDMRKIREVCDLDHQDKVP